MYAEWRKNQQGSATENMADTKDTADLLKKLNAAGDCKSLVKKYLTEPVQKSLQGKVTKFGGTLGDCIRSGVENLDSSTGIYAADYTAYDVFHDVFDGIIRDYHKVPKRVAKVTHPAPDFGDIDNLDFGDLDPEGKYVVSTRVRVGRSIEGYAFPPCIKDADRLEMEAKAKKALCSLTGELKGEYYPLVGMTKEKQTELVNDHFLFNDHDRFLRSAGGYNDWPNGRGIYFNTNKTFLSWVNEEDHMRIISMQKGGNLGEVYKRLVTAIKSIEKTVPFAHHKDLGYLTFCPTNLGTTLRASVHARLPNVSALPDFKEICNAMNLQPRGIHGEHTESVGGVYDVSNKRRLGLTEYQAIKEMAQGVQVLLLLEKSLEGYKPK